MALINIIIIHSTGSIRNHIKRFLLSEFTDTNIAEAESAEAALDLMFHHHYDLILVQDDLPDMTINNFDKNRKHMEHYKETPLIVFTSSETESDLDSLKESGIEHFLDFPFPLEDLKYIVSSLTDPRQKRQQDRYHIPGATALLSQCVPEITGDLINISKGGMLIEIPYNQQLLNILGKNVIHLSFGESSEPPAIRFLMCKTARMRVISWNNDNSPERIRLSLAIIDSPSESNEMLERILEKAKNEQMYDHSDEE